MLLFASVVRNQTYECLNFAPCEYGMNPCNVSCFSCQPVANGCYLSFWPAVLRGKNLNVGQYGQSRLSDIFNQARLIGTIDFYHFIPCSVALTLAGDHKKVSTKQNMLASLSRTLLN